MGTAFRIVLLAALTVACADRVVHEASRAVDGAMAVGGGEVVAGDGFAWRSELVSDHGLITVCLDGGQTLGLVEPGAARHAWVTPVGDGPLASSIDRAQFIESWDCVLLAETGELGIVKLDTASGELEQVLDLVPMDCGDSGPGGWWGHTRYSLVGVGRPFTEDEQSGRVFTLLRDCVRQTTSLCEIVLGEDSPRVLWDAAALGGDRRVLDAAIAVRDDGFELFLVVAEEEVNVWAGALVRCSITDSGDVEDLQTIRTEGVSYVSTDRLGRRLCFGGRHSGAVEVLDAGSMQLVYRTRTPDEVVVLSPDGSKLARIASGKLTVVELGSSGVGEAVRVASVPNLAAIAGWSPSGDSLAVLLGISEPMLVANLARRELALVGSREKTLFPEAWVR